MGWAVGRGEAQAVGPLPFSRSRPGPEDPRWGCGSRSQRSIGANVVRSPPRRSCLRWVPRPCGTRQQPRARRRGWRESRLVLPSWPGPAGADLEGRNHASGSHEGRCVHPSKDHRGASDGPDLPRRARATRGHGATAGAGGTRQAEPAQAGRRSQAEPGPRGSDLASTTYLAPGD